MRNIKIFFVALAIFTLFGTNTYAIRHNGMTESVAMTGPFQATVVELEQLGANMVKVYLHDANGTCYESQAAVDPQYTYVGQIVNVVPDPNNPQGILALLCLLTPAVAVCVAVIIIIVLWPKPAH
jgi:uncharacterized membrane protein